MHLFARDEAGNEARGDFDNVLPEAVQEEPHRARRQVPRPRRAGDPRSTARAEAAKATTIAAFLKINGELRRMNAAKIAALAKKTLARDALARRLFQPFGNNAVEAAFADHRTYVYKGKEVDQQTHLGFDLAVTGTCRSSRRTAARSQRRLARHLRQLRDHRPRHGRAVALRPPVVVRRQGGDTVARSRSSAGAA